MLPIIQYTDLFDFQKRGNYINWQIGLNKSPSDTTLTYWFDGDNDTLTDFEARKIKIVGKEAIIIDTIDLLAIDPPIYVSETEQWEHPQRIDLPSNLDSGLYYLYIKSASFELKSELFCVDETILVTSRTYLIDNNGDFLIDNLGDKIYQPNFL